MANHYLADMKLLQRDNESADSALSAYEKDMFGFNNKPNDKTQGAQEADQNSLRYLFAIFH